MKSILILIISAILYQPHSARTHPAIERFISSEPLRGASVSIMVSAIDSDSALYSYDADREVVPASVMKLITTATALETLGGDFRYKTTICYDGVIEDSILKGNLYIEGSGDPTTGSSELKGITRDEVFMSWTAAVKKVGIRKITGSVIADESVFDTEGVSMKWLREDLGSYYGQGCYGINVFDNRFTLYISTDGVKPTVGGTNPLLPELSFHNYLRLSDKDSCYITGFPYSNERWLYGTVPASANRYELRGDIPDPPLFAAQYFFEMLKREGVSIDGKPNCYRKLKEEGKWRLTKRNTIITTSSPPLKEMIRITNNVSCNLYADAFLKTTGLQCNEQLSSFEKGVYVMHKTWNAKGIDTSPLYTSDGSGLAPTDKLSAMFLCKILKYMAYSKEFVESLPLAGLEGTVRNTLKYSKLQGKARLKSGSMSRVRSYAGYVEHNNRIYATVIIVNNFHGKASLMKLEIEQLLLSLFF